MTEQTNNTDLQASETEPMVFSRDGEAYTNSQHVAAYFGKRHDHVLRDIDGLRAGSPDLGSLYFQELNDHNPAANRMTRSFDLTKDGFTLLVMGYTGPKAMPFKLAYIAKFNAMEAELRAKQRVMLPAEILIAQGQALLAVERQQAMIAATQKEHGRKIAENERRLNQIETATDYFTVVGYARWAKNTSVDVKTAADLGRHATRRANHLGVKVTKIPDPRFGVVSQYPKAVLDVAWDEVFTSLQ